ncbi:MAG: galactonate dehydratase [Candidatus Dormibacteraceae bacterium]
MRIAKIETVVVDAVRCPWTFVVVETDEGLSGVGEATLEGRAESVVAIVGDLSRRLVGEDPARIQHLWQRMYRQGFWRNGVLQMTALSAIDQALWDLKGKALGVPVYELLGGACRERVRVYANGPRGDTPEAIAASARSIVERGYRALKMSPLGPTLPVESASALAPGIEKVAAVRETVGPGVRIGIDVHGRLSPVMAIAFAEAVRPYDIWFLEEPVLPEYPGGMAEVARRSPVPIATGERLFSKWDYREILAQDAASLWQPDLAHCGGISEALRIAAMAELNFAGVAPHNPQGPVNALASSHLGMAIPNFVALEFLFDRPDYTDSLTTTPLDVREGWLTVPRTPGLGIELDRAACAEHPYRPSDQPASFHDDGAVADW